MMLVVLYCASWGRAQPSVEFYPNYETIGVNVSFQNGADPEHDAVVSMQYTLPNDPSLYDGFAFTYVPSYLRYSSTVFFLKDDSQVSISVRVADATTSSNNIEFSRTMRTRSVAIEKSGGRKLYVAPDGSGQAFDSTYPGDFAAALNVVEGGDVVVLLGGRYYVGELRIGASGTGAAPIVIRSAAEQRAILDGSDSTEYTFKQVGASAVYVATVNVASANTNLVTVNGVRGYPYGKLSDLANMELSCILPVPQYAGVGGFFRDPRPNTLIPFQIPNPRYRELYVRSTDGGNVNSKKVRVSSKRNALTLRAVSNVVLRGLQIEMYGVAPFSHSILIDDCENITIDGCEFIHNDIPILLDGNSSNILIQNSSFSDDVIWDTYLGKATYEPETPALCYGLTVPDLYPNLDRMLEKGGLVYTHQFMGRGITVRENVFQGTMDGLKGVPPSVIDSATREIDIIRNVISGADDAVELDGHCANVRFIKNVIHGSHGSISMAPPLIGPLYVVRNLIYDLYTSRATISGYDTLVKFFGAPFKFSFGDTIKGGDVYYLHNTSVAMGDKNGYGMYIFYPSRFNKFTALNNVFVSDTGLAYTVINMLDTILPPIFSDYNWFQTLNPAFGRIWLNGKTLSATSTASIFASTGNERNSYQGDQKFSNQSGLDFRPLPSSPISDAGAIIPGINQHRFTGVAPDIGAFESQPVASVKGANAMRLSVGGKLVVDGSYISVDGSYNFVDGSHNFVDGSHNFVDGSRSFVITNALVGEVERGELMAGETKIYLNNLSSGIYLLRVFAKDGRLGMLGALVFLLAR